MIKSIRQIERASVCIVVELNVVLMMFNGGGLEVALLEENFGQKKKNVSNSSNK